MREKLTPDSIGTRAKEVRLDRLMQQQQIADLMGLSLRAWQKMERDEGTPSGETLLAFKRLGINPGWILSGLGPKRLTGWLNDDAHAEMFMRIADMIMAIHAEMNIALPKRGLAISARIILADLIEELDSNASPDEVEAAFAVQAAKLRRSLQEAREQPGSGKRSAL